MARETKTTAAVRAREAARERANPFREAENKLEEEAVAFFIAQEQLNAAGEKGQREHDALSAKLEARIADLRERTSEKQRELAERIATEKEAHESDQRRAMENMLSLNVTRREVAQRLGVKLADVPRSVGDDSTSDESTSGNEGGFQAQIYDQNHEHWPH